MVFTGLPLKIQSMGYLKIDRLSFEGGSGKCQIDTSLALSERNRTVISTVAFGAHPSFLLALQEIRTFFLWSGGGVNLIFHFSGRSQIKLFRHDPPGMC